jgi:hypothetical protein
MTQNPGSWVQAEGGRWHLALTDEPALFEPTMTACGRAVAAFNVTWREAPPTVYGKCKVCNREET